MTKINLFIGIDISKAKFDVYFNPIKKHIIVKNNLVSISKFIQELKSYDNYNISIGIESTGRYHNLLFKEISLSTNYKISLINSKRTHHFFKSYGDIAKLDKKDAKLVSYYLEKIVPPESKFNPGQEKFKSLITRRKQIVGMISQQKTQTEQFQDDKFIIQSGSRIIKYLTKELLKIEEKINSVIDNNEEYSKDKKIIESVPGIGKVCTMTLLSYLPELGKLNRQEITSLVGLAPKNRDSGLFKGKRRIIGGRQIVRNGLYMCALSATRVKNNVFSKMYAKLIKSGKPAKLALTAIARKLLITLNSMIKTRKIWEDKLLKN